MDPNQRTFSQSKEAFQYLLPPPPPPPPPQEPPRMDQLPYPSFIQNIAPSQYRLPLSLPQEPPRIRSSYCFRTTLPENSVQGSPFPAESEELSALEAGIARLRLGTPYNPRGVDSNDEFLLARARSLLPQENCLIDQDQLMMIPRRNGSIYYNPLIGSSIQYPDVGVGVYPTRSTRVGSISIADHPYGNPQASTFIGTNQLIRRGGVAGTLGDYWSSLGGGRGGGCSEFLVRDQHLKYLTHINSLGNYVGNNRVVHGSRGDNNTMTLDQLRGRIVISAKEQPGCRALQKHIEEGDEHDINMIFEEVIDHVEELMIDPSGNYVMQKLVCWCSDEQRTRILRRLIETPNVLLRTCLNTHGTRAVQKLLENLKEPDQHEMVVHALSSGAVSLAKNTNGHHVLQHCLENFPADLNSELLRDVADHCYEISVDQCGCCVMQHCIRLARGEPGERIVEEIIANVLPLSEDKYGNYVVQYLLGMNRPDVIRNLLMQLQGHYSSLARTKYSSHVVEKCLKEISGGPKDNIIMELLRSPDIAMLLMDPFGNYVMQIAIDHSEGYVLDAMRRTIRFNTPMMSSNKYGKKVLDRLVARLRN